MKILLMNGTIYDGSNTPPIKGDIYIENGFIKQIGSNLKVRAKRKIDCTGLIIAPGFIDAHSHNDFFATDKEYTLPFLRQGITTQIVGNCGFSSYAADKTSVHNEFVGGGLFHTNNPGSLNDYSKEVKGKLIHNIVPLIGHGTTRITVNGMSSSILTSEKRKMQLDLLEENLKQGAFGASIGLMYEPGMYAPFEELVEVAQLVKKYDGILTVHPRANSKIALGYPLLSKTPHIEQGLDEVIRIMESSKVRVEYSHLIFVGAKSWKSVDPMLDKFNKYNEEGFDIAFDIYPFTYGASVINVVLPDWYLKLDSISRKKKITILKLKLIINITKKLLGIDFDDLIISYIGPDYPQYEGKNVAQIAKEENMKPIDMYIKLVDISNGQGRIMLGKYYNDEIIKTLMKHPLTIYMTDAWYEPSGTQNGGAYQAFPYFLQKSKEYNYPLEQTINKMTGLTADRFRIKNRGYIKENYAADITIFDYSDLAIDFSNPASTPNTIKYVLINGEVVLENKIYNNITTGILLKK